MPATRAQLERAAFWDQAVCLYCGTIAAPDAEPDDLCEGCEAPGLVKAARVLNFIELMEAEE